MAMALTAGLMALLALPSASDAATLEVESRLVTDGTAPFDATDDTGSDSSDTNGRIRSNDLSRFRVDWNLNDADATDHHITMVLSPGMRWLTLPPSCEPTASFISADGLTLDCATGDHHEGTNGAITAEAVALSVANGTTVTMTASATDAEGGSFTAPPVPVIVTSLPRTNARARHALQRPVVMSPVTDQFGTTGSVVVWPIAFGPQVAPGFPAGPAKGAGPVAADFDFVETLSGATPGTRLVDFPVPLLGPSGACGPWSMGNAGAPFGSLTIDAAATPDNATVDSGSWTCTPRPADGHTIDVAVTDAVTDPASWPTRGANGASLGAEPWQMSGQFATFTPDRDLSGTHTLGHTISAFDPAGTDGVTSNYGAGTEPTSDNSNSVEFNTASGSGSFNRSLTIYNESLSMTEWDPGSTLATSYDPTRYSVDTIPQNFYGKVTNPYPLTATSGIPRPGDSQVLPGDPLIMNAALSGIWTGMRHFGMQACVAIDTDMFRLRADHPSYPFVVQSGEAPDYYETVATNAPLPAGAGGVGAHSVAGAVRNGQGVGEDGWFRSGVTVEFGDGTFADLSDQRNARCADGDSTTPWVTDPDLLPGGPSSVSMVRFRVDDPDVFADADASGDNVSRSYRVAGLLIPVEVAPGATPDSIAYAYMNGGHFDLSTPDDVAWANPNYDHNAHQANSWGQWSGDRVFVRDHLATIDKSSPVEGQSLPAGALVPWQIDVTAIGANKDVEVTDTLPDGLEYVAGSAWPPPSQINGQELTWDLSTLTDEVAEITYVTAIAGNTDPGSTIINPAELTTPGRPTVTDLAGVSVREPSNLFAVTKSVTGDIVPVDTALNWELTYQNVGETPLGDVDMIDVLPFVGDDGAGTRRLPPSDFTGTLELTELTASDANETLLVTSRPPDSVSLDPQDSSNQPGAATSWCALADLGTNSCPGGLDDVTAWRFQSAGPLAAGETHTIGLTLQPTDNQRGDLYTNSFGGRVDGITLPVVSNDVSITVADARVGDFVWHDRNVNGIQDDGEPPIADVTVELLDDDDAVLATAQTDSEGRYLFDRLPPGTYTIRFIPPSGWLRSPDTVARDRSVDSNELTTTITLALGDADLTIDAGFHRPDDPTPTDDPSSTDDGGDSIPARRPASSDALLPRTGSSIIGTILYGLALLAIGFALHTRASRLRESDAGQPNVTS